MFRASLVAVLVAGSAFAQDRVRVAVHPIVAPGVDDPKLVSDLNREVANILAETQRVTLVATEDVEKRLAEEGGKCPARGKERTDCLERVALATRAVYIIAVVVKRLGKDYELTATIADSDRVLLEQPDPVAATDATLKPALKELLVGRCRAGALPSDPRMRNPVPPAMPPPVVEATKPDGGSVVDPVDPDSASSRKISMAVAGLGLAGVIAGSVLLGVGASNARAALNPDTGNVLADRTQQFSEGRSFQVAGGVMLAVGAVAALGGGMMTMMSMSSSSSASQTKVTVAPSPGGASVCVGGTW